MCFFHRFVDTLHTLLRNENRFDHICKGTWLAECSLAHPEGDFIRQARQRLHVRVMCLHYFVNVRVLLEKEIPAEAKHIFMFKPKSGGQMEIIQYTTTWLGGELLDCRAKPAAESVKRDIFVVHVLRSHHLIYSVERKASSRLSIDIKFDVNLAERSMIGS